MVKFLKECLLLLPRLSGLVYRLMKDPRVIRADRVLVAAVLAYVVTPADLLPDFIPFTGYLDDLLALSLVILRLIDNSGEFVVRQHWRGSADVIRRVRQIASLSEIFLPEKVARELALKFGPAEDRSGLPQRLPAGEEKGQEDHTVEEEDGPQTQM